MNHIAIGPDYFIKFWKKEDKRYIPQGDKIDCSHDFYNIYHLKELAFAYFISNLRYELDPNWIEDRSWLYFPIRGTKEKYRLPPICIEP